MVSQGRVCLAHYLLFVYFTFLPPFNSEVWKWRWDGLWVSVVVTGLLILAVSQEHNHRKTLGTNSGFESLNLKRKRKGREGYIFMLVCLFVLIISLCGWRCRGLQRHQLATFARSRDIIMEEGRSSSWFAGKAWTWVLGHVLCPESPCLVLVWQLPWPALATCLYLAPELSVPSYPVKAHVRLLVGFGHTKMLVHSSEKLASSF